MKKMLGPHAALGTVVENHWFRFTCRMELPCQV